ncbi:TRAP transporter substrate-binding protein [Thermodesulfobacteriota bacterium]
MKKVGTIFGILAFVLLMTGAFPSAPAASSGKVWKLKGSCLFPPSGPRWDNLMQFVKKVKERTNGQVDLEVIPSGGLAPAQEEYDYLGKKLIDFSMGADAWIAAVKNEFGIFGVPGMDAKDVPAILKAGVLDALDRVAAKDNIKLVSAWQSLGFQGIAMRTKHLKKPADFKGALLFHTGPFLDKTHEILGAKPTPVSVAELYTSLQTGVLHGVTTSVSAIKAFKMFEVCPYVTAFPGTSNLGLFAYLPAFNLDVWKSFPADIQKTIIQAADEVSQQSVANWMKGRKATEAFFKGMPDKVKFYQLSESEAQTLINKVKGPLKEFYLKRGGQGEKEIMAIVDKFYGR